MPNIALVRRDGLPAALRRLFADVARDGLQIHFDVHDYMPQPLDREEALYRIAQEALNNVVKHAHARQVEIELSTLHGSTRLTVQDDGRGLALEAVGMSDARRHRPPAGFGIKRSPPHCT
jgi:two-component system NarL family sensor kinase